MSIVVHKPIALQKHQQIKQMNTQITLGILGGGQLGRMSTMAAARLGISVIIFCPEENSPASHVAKETIVAAYDDKEALKKFIEKTDVISYEFENIPVETISYIESLKPKSIFPEKALLDVSQDRIKEKSFLNENNIRTARWSPVATREDIASVLSDWRADSFILKTARFGYDGKGQIKCDTKGFENNSELNLFLENTKKQDLIMEEVVDFSCETSVIIARDKDGKTEVYGPMLNEHKNHILHKTFIPANVSKHVSDQTSEIANVIANSVNLRGVLTVELFVLNDDHVLVNEIAPRTHNSGHWSIDACAVSQFENHVRTVCGLPVGSSKHHSHAVMLNLIGNDINQIQDHIGEPNTCIHSYGKETVRDGRKMGHITFLKPIDD